MAEKRYGRCWIRTNVILGVNGEAPRKSAIFSPASDGISPLCAAFVRAAFAEVVPSGTPEPIGWTL
jgi:hypothetical protein